jgi:hypothetical protein
MDQMKKEETEPDWTAIRLAYEDPSVKLREMAPAQGVTWQKIVHEAVARGWRSRAGKRPRRKTPTTADRLLGSELRPGSLATRLKRLIAREIETIEGERAATRDAMEKERDARRLGSLVRSLEKLNDIKAAKEKREPRDADDAGADDDRRAELERRLAGLAAGGATVGVSGEPVAGGDKLAP